MEIYNEEINDLLAPGHQKVQIDESLKNLVDIAWIKSFVRTVYKSELSKEGIALSLEEEKKARACQEIRLLEQERKI
ncbi:hypothetical protein HPP92_006565 [Vanilla planifolia]|uniref:Kinesin motor domain-containing protein n=1 Tax=Vanilla planifolia TaxID=51239 RepID=A0A835RW71_VANPL|nr:hypothetical protein HPP92_006565 [Vanilla planifolia]